MQYAVALGHLRHRVITVAVIALIAVTACRKKEPAPAELAQNSALELVRNLPADPANAQKLRAARFDHLDQFPKVRVETRTAWDFAAGGWAIPAPDTEVTKTGRGFQVRIRFRYRGEQADGSGVFRRGEALVNTVQAEGRWQSSLISLVPLGDVSLSRAAGRWAFTVGVGTLMLLLSIVLLTGLGPGKITTMGELLLWLVVSGWWLLIFALPLFIASFAGTAWGATNAFGSRVFGAFGVLAMLALSRAVWVLVSRFSSNKTETPLPDLLGPAGFVPKDVLLAHLRETIGAEKYRELVDQVGEDALYEFAKKQLKQA